MTSTTLTEADDPLCRAPGLDGAPWRRFATIGDSLSAGTGDPSPGYAPLGWPDRVAGALRRVHPEIAFLNAAEIGATTARTLATQMERLAEFRPDLVHLPCGANDLFHPEPDFALVERNLRRVFALAAGTGAQLTVFTLGRAFRVPRFADWTERVRTVNAITRALAAEHGAALVDMWDHPVNDRPGLLSADGIHFATMGQAVMAAEVARALRGVLDGG